MAVPGAEAAPAPAAHSPSLPPLSPLPSQDLGADAFHHLVAKVPWVLLLDGDTHG